MTPPDPAARLRKASALRALCLRLGHLPTETESRRLRRFEDLVAAPQAAGPDDTEALIAGLRQWWRGGKVAALWDLVARLPHDIVDLDQRLQTLTAAGRLARWRQVQAAIWDCTACAGQARIATNVRQQTEVPHAPVRLLIVSLAPPFRRADSPSVASSATNDPQDQLRLFLEEALRRRWSELENAGMILLHTVKRAIEPADGSQNPPRTVVDICAPRHLAIEIGVLRPTVVVTLGERAYRGLVRALEVLWGPPPRALNLVDPPAAARSEHGAVVPFLDGSLTLFAAPFIRGGEGRSQAQAIVRRAAARAGVVPRGA